MKRGLRTLLIWSLALSSLLAICVFIYPEMKSQVEPMSRMMAEMGGFSAAFGMDRINFGTLTGYFAVECGNMLGIGGALFAAILGVSALAKEEKEHTAEFLLTHPISRAHVVTGKLAALLCQIALLNLITAAVSLLSFLAIGEAPEAKPLLLLFLAFFLLQLVIAGVSFGVSAFLSGNGLGPGIGLALLTYFLNLIANLTKNAEFLKYFTPFAFAESADILVNGKIEIRYLAIGLAAAAVCVSAAYLRYSKKDIAS